MSKKVSKSVPKWNVPKKIPKKAYSKIVFQKSEAKKCPEKVSTNVGKRSVWMWLKVFLCFEFISLCWLGIQFSKTFSPSYIFPLIFSPIPIIKISYFSLLPRKWPPSWPLPLSRPAVRQGAEIVLTTLFISNLWNVCPGQQCGKVQKSWNYFYKQS